MNDSLGFAHFLTNADGVATTILVLMVLASVGTWFLIVLKGIVVLRQRSASRTFLDRFWNASSLEDVARDMRSHGVTDPFSHLVHEGFSAVETLRSGSTGTRGLIATGSADEFLTRALKRSIERDRSRMEYGQTFLASVASSAPFIGLLGTVWGIYHALLAIGMSGQGTLDKVAGPVGEALIMTAIGLATAIPAALAFNFFARSTRNVMGELNSFAHDVFVMLSTGVKDSGSNDPKATGDRVLSLVEHARTHH
ncbi:MotA/TolQ/ExbB proton channel family protein [Methyloversatilis sp.]|uniref:MotA/TolQ/ExbB proton channel family protein n=1 Tax=Methyloversatilis sp. TaxID=2569862 RepID=UPI0035B2F930